MVYVFSKLIIIVCVMLWSSTKSYHLLLQDYGETCPEDRAFVEFDDFQKEYIVRLHNRMRNKIALGEVKKFNTAARMPALVSIQIENNIK